MSARAAMRCAVWLLCVSLSFAESREHRSQNLRSDSLSEVFQPEIQSTESGWERALELAKGRDGDDQRRAFYAKRKRQREAARKAAEASSAESGGRDIDESVEAAVSKHHEENVKKAHNVKHKVTNAHSDIPNEAERDARVFYRNFLPGWAPDRSSLSVTGLATVTAMIWFLGYLRFAYQCDRGKPTDAHVVSGLGHQEGDNVLNIPHIHSPGQEADIVIMFHHPNFDDHPDGEEPLSQAASDVVFGPTALGRKLDFQHLKKLQKLTNRTAREALLKDLLEGLPSQGFDIDLFTSICGTVLFLTVSLRNQAWINHYMMIQHKKLQLKRHLVEKLGIGRTEDYAASSPPFISFQPWITRRLRDCGIIEDEDPRQVFVTDHHADKSTDSVDLSTDRIRSIFVEVIQSLDLDSATEEGLILGWYPVHQISWVRCLMKTWGDFRLVKDLSFQQPIHYINNYFGTRLAFTFAWNGLYCKLLLALLPVALFWEFAYHMYEMRQVMSFSVIIIVWAKLAVNMWEREEQYLMSMWHCVVEDGGIIRPQFRGELRTSIIDSNVKDLVYPAWKANLRKAFSFSVTFMFCIAVSVCIYFWVNITYSSESGGNIFASIFLAAQVKFFEIIFNHLSERLNAFENHKHQVDDYNSYLSKQFLFQFVNNYTAFFYLAVKQRFTEAGCPPGGCLFALRRDLSVTLVVLTIARVGEVLVASVTVKRRLQREAAALRKKHDGEPPLRSFTELQSNYGFYREREQVETMIQLLVSFGFVVLFGGIAPIIVPFSFFLFAVQLRASAYFLLTGAQRPFPRRSMGIGAWHGIVQWLMYFGVVFAGVLLVLYGDMFQEVSVITRVSGVIAFCLVMCIIIEVVSLAFPPLSHQAHTLEERRQLVENRLMELVGEVDGAKMEDSQSLQKAYEDQNVIDAVDLGQWDRIPTMTNLAAP